ncbi:TMhelix containing protein [Vibrio phage 1.113.A._10N.286.51.E7]|nr:TMhelix containing protein [Vibrio phage 1.113.A._10N.286.51.E7]
MFEFIVDNYWEIAAAFSVIYMALFMCVNKVFDSEYSSGIVITAIVVSTLTWPFSAPYFLIGTIVDNAFKGKKNAN